LFCRLSTEFYAAHANQCKQYRKLSLNIHDKDFIQDQ
jgi:hypothetical protein